VKVKIVKVKPENVYEVTFRILVTDPDAVRAQAHEINDEDFEDMESDICTLLAGELALPSGLNEISMGVGRAHQETGEAT